MVARINASLHAGGAHTTTSTADVSAHVGVADMLALACADPHVNTTNEMISSQCQPPHECSRHDDLGARVSAHVGAPSRLDAAIVRTQAKAALTGLGWNRHRARGGRGRGRGSGARRRGAARTADLRVVAALPAPKA